MPQEIHTHRLENGLIVLVETMDWVESAALTIALPAGSRFDPPDQRGIASFVAEMSQRGAGSRNSREFLEALERLGADHSPSATVAHTSYSAAMLAENLSEVAELHADLVRRPRLPTEQLEEARSVCLLEIQSLEDDLARRTIQTLKNLTYPGPYGLSSSGTSEGIRAIQSADLQRFRDEHYGPDGTIVSVAGKVQFAEVVETIDRLFGDWPRQPASEVAEVTAPRGYEHIPHESHQTHIAIAYKTVPYRHPDYFQSRGAVGVLSDGMSSRLFTEVREKRGLCYSVYASYSSLPDEGRVFAYAGTTSERAQETLNVMLAELQRLCEGIDLSELDRLKARVRSALIMQQENSISRAGSMAADWYHLGRVRSMDEVDAIIDGLTVDSVNSFLANNPPGDFDIVTLGQDALEVPHGLS